jgi:triosephosphate isomerase
MTRPTRKKFIAGNWKMYKTLPEALELVSELKTLVSTVDDVDIAVIPPALFVHPVALRLADSKIHVGVQNIQGSGFAAQTGELSADMLASVGARFCLAGHSERRQFYGETDAGVNAKVKAILQAGLVPILCIGETIGERQAGNTFQVLERQMAAGLDGITDGQLSSMVVAYEPVWAIGTGHTATTSQVAEVHHWLRSWGSRNFMAATADALRIQYGGSVKPSNAKELMHVPDVDGALVGGASLDARSFCDIIKASQVA